VQDCTFNWRHGDPDEFETTLKKALRPFWKIAVHCFVTGSPLVACSGKRYALMDLHNWQAVNASTPQESFCMLAAVSLANNL
jgi:hypothetical protein